VTFLVDLERVFLFTLLLARASGLVVTAPLLGERMVPRAVRVGFALFLAILMTSIAPAGPAVPESLVAALLLVAAELSVGLAAGFVARLVLLAFEMAGSIVSVQMGFAMARIVDPLQPNQTSIMGRWLWMIGLTLFLGLNGHHHLLRAVAGTLEILPPGTGIFHDATLATLVDLSAATLGTAMAIAAPAIGLLLMTSMGLGILARTVPQMNVFIVGFPIKITAGIVGVLLSLPYLLEIARRETAGLARQLALVIQPN
jgi:flagellar biosynthetic protein FliR